VEKAIKDHAVASFSNLIVKFTNLLEKQDPNDPIFALSDKLGVKLAKSSVWEIIKHLLPFKLGQEAEKALHFATMHGS
jgi:hypothetical protein